MKNKLRNVMKKFTVIALMVSMMAGMLIQNVSASQVTITVTIPYGINSDVNNKWTIGTTFTSNVGTNYDVYSIMTSSDRGRVWCIQPTVNVNAGTHVYNTDILSTYLPDANVRKQIGYVSALGYGFQGDTSDEMAWATQIRIWQEVQPGFVVASTIHPEIQAKINTINSRLAVMNSYVSFDGTTVTLNGWENNMLKH